MISLKNWKETSKAGLVMASGIVGSVTAFTPQFLSVLHEAPFPISNTVDAWVEWSLKMSTISLAFFTIFTKKADEKQE